MKKMNTVQPLFPHLPERLAGLEELAENLWWSWNPGARMLFKTLDRQAWKESGHNPDKMLREFPRELLNVEINDPWNRGISARLYIGDLEQRLRQEIVLGLGGAEVLKTLGIEHYLLHLNEGHAAFALLERIRTLVSAGSDFTAACQKNINTTIFTTHTPVPAGHDVFPFQLIEKYFHSYWPDLGLDRDAFFKLGTHPEKPGAGFNMTAFALKLSGYRNGVSKRHAEVSRKMWRSLWSDVPEDQIKK